MLIAGLFFRLLLLLLFLATTAVFLALALGKAIQQKRIRDKIRRLNRSTVNPIILRSAGKRSSDYAAVTHLGRRSGRPYITPVRAIPCGEGFVIPLPYGADTDWCRNAMTAGKCTLRWHEQEYLLGQLEVVPLARAWESFPLSLRITAVTNGVKQCLVLHPCQEVPG